MPTKEKHQFGPEELLEEKSISFCNIVQFVQLNQLHVARSVTAEDR
jgi:hypothetical protein